MMEILFKAKRVDNGEWVEGDLLHSYFKKGDTCICCPDWTNIKRVDPATLCQYTGLTDKNGVKIFEGDILDENGEHFTVIYDAKWAKFKLKYTHAIQYPEWNRGVLMEVIGSIHDTPELIGQTATPHADPIEAGTTADTVQDIEPIE